MKNLKIQTEINNEKFIGKLNIDHHEIVNSNIKLSIAPNVSSIQLPIHWDINQLNGRIEISPGNEEYDNVMEIVKKNDLTGVIKNIVKIERIQNLILYAKYEAYKRYLEIRDVNGVNERIMFHGTTGCNAVNISKVGFKCSYSGKNARGMFKSKTIIKS